MGEKRRIFKNDILHIGKLIKLKITMQTVSRSDSYEKFFSKFFNSILHVRVEIDGFNVGLELRSRLLPTVWDLKDDPDTCHQNVGKPWIGYSSPALVPLHLTCAEEMEINHILCIK